MFKSVQRQGRKAQPAQAPIIAQQTHMATSTHAISSSAPLDQQTRPKQGGRFGHSFARIPIFDPNSASTTRAVSGTNEPQTLLAAQAVIQRKLLSGKEEQEQSSERASFPTAQDDTSSLHIRQAARIGMRSPASKLPFVEQIQQAFGRHDISQVQAHLGQGAAANGAAIQAAAYTTGNHIVFGRQPDLSLTAHEAAHVVQQRGGIRPVGGIGQVGDRYEQHADLIARKVLAGQSAEDLLNRFAGTVPRGRIPGDARPLAEHAPLPAQLHTSGGIVQMVKKDKYDGPSPPDAEKPIHYFKNAKGTWLATDKNQERWYLRADGRWQKTGKKKKPTYGRTVAATSGRGGFRSGSMRAREGSASSYKETGTRSQANKKVSGGVVKGRNRGKRKQAQVMGQVTGQQSATLYAASVGAPVLAGYEWCHLLGRGAGGKDTPSNLVAASKYANTEMLAMEKVYYDFSSGLTSKDVSAHWEAVLVQNTQVASLLIGTILVDGEVVLQRKIDGFRNQPVSDEEMQSVQDKLTSILTDIMQETT